MRTRTRRATVRFTAPFRLAGLDEALPAGTYEMETDEELLDGVSFSAYRRVLTVLNLLPDPGRPGVTRTLTVDPADLDAALARDRAGAEPAAARVGGRAPGPGATERAENDTNAGASA